MTVQIVRALLVAILLSAMQSQLFADQKVAYSCRYANIHNNSVTDFKVRPSTDRDIDNIEVDLKNSIMRINGEIFIINISDSQISTSIEYKPYIQINRYTGDYTWTSKSLMDTSDVYDTKSGKCTLISGH